MTSRPGPLPMWSHGVLCPGRLASAPSQEKEPEGGVGVTLQSCAGSVLQSEASLTLIL